MGFIWTKRDLGQGGAREVPGGGWGASEARLWGACDTGALGGGLGPTLPGVREPQSGREAAPVRRIVDRHVLSETHVGVVRGCRF